MSRESAPIYLLSETWLAPGEQLKFSGYDLIHCARQDGYGGSAILISKKIPYVTLNVSNNFQDKIQICAIKILLPGIQTIIVSVYAAPNHSLSTRDWIQLFQQFPQSVIIGGDMNVHHVAWGYSFSDVSGRSFLDALDQLDLCFLNDGSSTLIPRPNMRNSAPDLTVCSANLAAVCCWSLLPDTFGSDHYIISTNFYKHRATQISRGQRAWKTKKADWDRYALSMNNICETEQPQTYADFLEMINTAAQESIPRSRNRAETKRFKPRANHWWDGSCQAAWNEKQQRYRQYKRQPSITNYLAAKESEARCRRVFKTKKRENWIKFCESINKEIPLSYVWKRVRKLKGCEHHSERVYSENLINEIFDTLAPPFVPENILIEDIEINNTADLNGPFTITELNAAMKINCNSSPGYDEVQYCMLWNLPINAKHHLLKVLNRAWLEDKIEPEWNIQIICPILKPEKSALDAKSYRPIALSSCIIKTFERMIKTRLEWWIEKNNVLPDFQHGFRRGHNTYDNITTLIGEVYQNFSIDKVTLAVFLDISNAYNNVNISILKEVMMNMGIPGRLVKICINLIKTRQIYIKANNQLYGPRMIHHGLPQGAVLSPILFALYTSSIQNLASEDLKITQFADDFTLYVAHKSEQQAINIMNLKMHQLKKWLLDMGFSLSEEKSTAMVLTRRHNISNNTILNLGPYKIKTATKTRFLGLVIDRKLLWKSHLLYVEEKCEQALNVIRCLTKIRYGAHPSIALLLYRTLILSRIDYGCIVYGDAAKTNLARLDRLQNRALRVCLGAMISTSTNALMAEAKIMPLDLRWEQQTCI